MTRLPSTEMDFRFHFMTRLHWTLGFVHWNLVESIGHVCKMAAFREAREALMFTYQDGSIDDTEFALLYDLNSSQNLEFPYWKYGRFDLDSMTDDEYKAEFRFYKNDVYLLGEVLDIPDIMKCLNGVVVDGMEALSVLLKRFAYPCRFADMIARFGRPVPPFHDYKPNNGPCI